MSHNHNPAIIEQALAEDGQICCAAAPANISNIERWVSLGAGGLLSWVGLRQGKLAGLLTAGIGAGLLYRGWTGHCQLYESLGVNTREHAEQTAIRAQEGIKIERRLIINRPVEELFAFWKNLEQLPKVFRHLLHVHPGENGRSRWVARGPFDRPFQWDAETINERENELIAWRSLPGGDLETAGSVHFRPLPENRGTELAVSLKYNPPGGKMTAIVADWFGGGLESILDEDLRSFKQLMEAGEVPTVEGQPSGREPSDA